jgi:hydrogenase maturation protease
MSVLVAGIGNVFFGDDGFGVAVAARMAGEPWPDDVHVVDVGIRTLHLAYQLLDGYDALVLVDAVASGEPPGTLVLLDLADEPVAGARRDPHGVDPSTVLGLLEELGGHVRQVLLVGCAPATTEGMGLSAAVAGVLDDAVDLVRRAIGMVRAHA